MKTTITLILTLIAGMAMGQAKHHHAIRKTDKTKPSGEIWQEGGGTIYWGELHSDTSHKSYTLTGKDSLSYDIETQQCRCDFYKDYEGHIKTCKGLWLHAIRQVYWHWVVTKVFVKDSLLSTGKPHWETNTSQASFVNGFYDRNGKYVYPDYVHIPMMMGQKWIKVN